MNADFDPATYTDRKGRTTADRIAAVERGGGPISDELRNRAKLLLDAMLQAAAQHGADLDDFDWVDDLPGACIDVVLHHAHRTGER